MWGWRDDYDDDDDLDYDDRNLDREWEDEERWEETAAHQDDLEEQTENIEENTREVAEAAEDGLWGGGGDREYDDGYGGLQTEEQVIAEERAIDDEREGIDQEWEEFFDREQDRDDDTEDPWRNL